MAEKQQAIVTIRNKLGLHARPAMALVELANQYESGVTIKREDGEEVVDAKSIMQVMLLAAGTGTQLVIEAEGADAAAAVAAIVDYVKRGFDED